MSGRTLRRRGGQGRPYSESVREALARYLEVSRRRSGPTNFISP